MNCFLTKKIPQKNNPLLCPPLICLPDKNKANIFAILLEYCCRTDYRMLISEISKEHKKELDDLDRDYQKKAEE